MRDEFTLDADVIYLKSTVFYDKQNTIYFSFMSLLWSATLNFMLDLSQMLTQFGVFRCVWRGAGEMHVNTLRCYMAIWSPARIALGLQSHRYTHKLKTETT